MSAHTFALRLAVLRCVMADRRGNEVEARKEARAIAVLQVSDAEVRDALAFIRDRVMQ